VDERDVVQAMNERETRWREKMIKGTGTTLYTNWLKILAIPGEVEKCNCNWYRLRCDFEYRLTLSMLYDCV